MKRLILLSTFAAIAAYAQSPYSTTTLSLAATKDSSAIVVASTTGINPGSELFLAQEAMLVDAIVGQTVIVQRGIDGTRAASHAAAETIYFAAPSAFRQGAPQGVCTLTGSTPEWIWAAANNVSTCTSGVWVNQNGGGGTGTIPAPTGSTLGGVFTKTCSGGQHIVNIDGTGTPNCSADSGGTVNAASQYAVPYYSDSGSSTAISGVAAPTTNGQYTYGYNVTGGVAAAPTAKLMGLQSRAVTGTTSTDTILYSDNNITVEYSGSVAVAVALPTPTTLGNANFFTILRNSTTGSPSNVTVTPATNTINGQSSLTILQSQTCRISVNPALSTDWIGACGDGPITAGSNVTVTRTAAGVQVASSSGTITGCTSGLTTSGSNCIADTSILPTLTGADTYSNTQTKTGVDDDSGATHQLLRGGTGNPNTNNSSGPQPCSSLNEVWVQTNASAGQSIFICTTTGTGGSGGTAVWTVQAASNGAISVQSTNLGNNTLSPAGTQARVLGTVYHNTNSYPIFVEISCSNATLNAQVGLGIKSDSSSTPSQYLGYSQIPNGGNVNSTWVHASGWVVPGNYYVSVASGCDSSVSSNGFFWNEWH